MSKMNSKGRALISFLFCKCSNKNRQMTKTLIIITMFELHFLLKQFTLLRLEMKLLDIKPHQRRRLLNDLNNRLKLCSTVV